MKVSGCGGAQTKRQVCVCVCALIFSGFHQQSYGDIEWHRTSHKFNVRIYLRWAVTQWKNLLVFGYQKPGQFHCHRCDAGGFQREPWQGVSGAWGGNMEITALAATLNRPITVMRGSFTPLILQDDTPIFWLYCMLDIGHYEALDSKDIYL